MADDFLSKPNNKYIETFKYSHNIGLDPENIEEFGNLLVGECGLKGSKKHSDEMLYILRGLKTVAIKKTTMLDCTMNVDEHTFIYGFLAGVRAEGKINVAYAICTLKFDMTPDTWPKLPKFMKRSKGRFDKREIQANFIEHRTLMRLKTEGIIHDIKYIK